MKKTLFATGIFFAMMSFTFIGCEKETDDDNNDTTQTDTSTTDTTTTGTTDTTSTGGTNTAEAGKLTFSDTEYDITGTSSVKIASGTTGQAVFNTTDYVTITTDANGFPTTATTYAPTALLPSETQVTLAVYVAAEGINYAPKNGGSGTVTITPKANGYYNISFENLEVVDNYFAPTVTTTITASYDVKNYGGGYSFGTLAQDYTISNTAVTTNGNVNVAGSSYSSTNTSGSLAVYLPADAGAGEYTVAQGTASDWLSPAANTIYVVATVYSPSYAAYNATSGTLTVTETDGDFKLEFTDLDVSDGTSSDKISGSIEWTLP